MTGRTMNRPAWNRLMQNIGVNDTIVIKELDRLGRNTEVIKDSYVLLERKYVFLEVIENDLLSTFGKSEA